MKHNGHTPRLVRIELHRLPDNNTLAVTPSRRMYRIESDPATVDHLLKTCDGRHPLDEIVSESENPDGFSEVLEAFLKDGCLQYAQPFSAENDWIRFGNIESLNLSGLSSTRLALIGDPGLIAAARGAGLLDKFPTTVEVESLEQLQPDAVENQRHTIVVSLCATFDRDYLLRVNDFCEAHQLRWLSFHFDQERGWAGPAIQPGCTPNYRDLLGRRLCAAEEIDVFQALTAPPQNDPTYLPPRSELLWMLAFLFVDLERWIAGAPAYCLWNEVELDPRTLTYQPHPILPLPDRQLPDATPNNCVKDGIELLVDERTGIVTHVEWMEHHPSVPSGLATAQSCVADINRLYPWVNNREGGGTSFENRNHARGAAIGEAVERYCGNWVQTSLICRASYNQLMARGEYAIDPKRLILYSENQYDTPGFPFVRFERDLQVYWVKGRSLTANRPAWLPMSHVYVNGFIGEFQDAPPTNDLFYPGLAAGMTLEFAIASALEEIIERHTTMIWWTNRQPLPSMALTPRLQALWEGTPEKMGQRAWLIHLDNEFNIPVMAGVVENVQDKLLNIGFAARHDPVEAALKAWAEALTLQEGSRDLLDPEGLYRQAVSRGEVNGDAMKPCRADRAYLDDYRPDFRDVNDLMCQQQVFLDPRARDHVRPWLDTAATRQFADLPALKYRTLDTLSQVLEEHGYEVFYTDITTPDVALTGMRVVRAIVPGLVPNFPAAFPCLGHAKIQKAAVDLGWRPAPLTEAELNYFPLPHA